MEYYDEDDEEQYPYDGVSYTAGDAVSDSKKKVISLGISAYSGGNDTPGTHSLTHSLTHLLTYLLVYNSRCKC